MKREEGGDAQQVSPSSSRAWRGAMSHPGSSAGIDLHLSLIFSLFRLIYPAVTSRLPPRTSFCLPLVPFSLSALVGQAEA